MRLPSVALHLFKGNLAVRHNSLPAVCGVMHHDLGARSVKGKVVLPIHYLIVI